MRGFRAENAARVRSGRRDGTRAEGHGGDGSKSARAERTARTASADKQLKTMAGNVGGGGGGGDVDVGQECHLYVLITRGPAVYIAVSLPLRDAVATAENFFSCSLTCHPAQRPRTIKLR